MEASLRLNEKPRVSLKIGCLPNAVGKQLSVPLIDLGRKWILSWWWQYFIRASICSCKWNELQLTVIFWLAHLFLTRLINRNYSLWSFPMNLALVVLSDIYWQPSLHRIFFTTATIPFKSLQVQQPSYFATLIPRYVIIIIIIISSHL